MFVLGEVKSFKSAHFLADFFLFGVEVQMSHSLKLTAQFAPENRPFAPKRKGSSSKHPYSGAFAVSFREGKSQDISISEFKKLHRNSFLTQNKSIYLEVKHGETIDRS